MTWWTAIGNVAQVAHRLDELGRAQCTDLEAAALAQLEGWAVNPDAPGVVARLALARLAGLAELRERMLAVAMGRAVAEQGQAATAAWLSRQHLGHSPAGIDEATRRKVARVQGLPRHELARVLRAALAKLEMPIAARSLPVAQESTS